VTARSESCPVCGSDDYNRLEEIELEQQHTHYAGHNNGLHADLTAAAREHIQSYRMLACRSCGLEYAQPLVNPGSRWYGLAYGALALYPEHRWEFDRALEQLGADDRIAEIGCGSGRFLSACSRSSVACVGFDFSQVAVAACRKQGLTAELVDLATCESLAPPPSQRFTKLTAFHVLEHLDDPGWFFRIAAASTIAGAEVLISVPSDRRASRVFGEPDFLDQPPHHLTRWTRASLEQVGLQAGWVLRRFEYEPLPIGVELWARSIRRPMYRRLIGERTPRWLERCFRLGFYPAAALARTLPTKMLSGFSMLASYRKSNTGTA
jgi:SAM-dependent methyltransferase